MTKAARKKVNIGDQLKSINGFDVRVSMLIPGDLVVVDVLRDVEMKQQTFHLSQMVAGGFIVNAGLPSGVSMQGNKFRAQIRVNGKNYSLGSYETSSEAGDAYIAAKNGRWRPQEPAKVNGNYRGVTPSGDKWRARVTIGGMMVNLGVFDTEIEAANAYRDAKLDHAIKTMPVEIIGKLEDVSAIKPLPEGISKYRGKFKAEINVHGKNEIVGIFRTVEMAVQRRDEELENHRVNDIIMARLDSQ